MSCKYIDRCPSATGWCNRDNPNYQQCIPFLLSAVETARNQLNEKPRDVLYECDRRACDTCNPECHYTLDVRHARNFQRLPNGAMAEGEMVLN